MDAVSKQNAQINKRGSRVPAAILKHQAPDGGGRCDPVIIKPGMS